MTTKGTVCVNALDLSVNDVGSPVKLLNLFIQGLESAQDMSTYSSQTLTTTIMFFGTCILINLEMP